MGGVKLDMDAPTDLAFQGNFEARYLAFLETIPHLRPRLHRYCTRMTGSAMDGEDIVQEALFQAYRKLDTFDDTRDLTPWLFRIAHNRCLDFLRGRRRRRQAEVAVLQPDIVMPVEPAGPMLHHSVEQLVLALAPRERACVLLKDVFDYTLEEIAELIGSTTGAVKAALNRGRSKLASLKTTANRHTAPQRTKPPASSRLLTLYVERFNQRDWDGIRELITTDARIRVADRFDGPLANAPYFGRFQNLAAPWRMALGHVDGEPAVIALRMHDGEWTPHSIARVDMAAGRITGVVDYAHCPWVVAAASVTVDSL
jgi:RNA polymerase sigma-70 factor (ECF subfamily)